MKRIKRTGKIITDFFAKDVTRQKLTPSIAKSNIDVSSPDNEYSRLGHLIEYEHGHRDSHVDLFDIQLCMLIKVQSF